MEQLNLNKIDVLKQLKEANKVRCSKFGHGGGINEWSPAEWACAVAGEVGEMCNLIKKENRGDKLDRDGITPITPELIGKEAADVVIYLDMLCQRLGIDLATAIVNKFNEVSDKIKSDIKISICEA